VTPPENLDSRLERIAKSTENIFPSAGFSARVMSAIGPRSLGVLDIATGSSRRFLSIAALAAAAAVFWAARSETSMDDALATTYGSMDVEW
jgi:hypothetical protein